ncbi:MAG TPA: MFS transporter [Galbitalea sp.]|jgi:MFS family permease|nr:MFS transporter [Galbitalea sp.]
MKSSTTASAPALIRSRIAVIAAFIVPGFVLGMYVVNIPAIKQNVGLTSGALGSVFVFAGLGAILGNQVAGFASDRFGSRAVTLWGAVLCCVAVVFPGIAASPFALAPFLFVLGIGVGSVDVGMNQQAVVVQKAYGRPIMASFHAFYSLGGALGAAIGAGVLALRWPLPWGLILAGAIGLVFVGVATGGLVRERGASRDDDAASSAGSASAAASGMSSRSLLRMVLLMGIAALLLMLSEGVANDWSALQLRQRLGAPPAVAAFGYGSFAISMLVARLFGDRLAGRLGAVRTVRFGSLLAAAGLATIVLSDNLALTLIGWAVLGLGLSGCVPQIFTAAGNLPFGARGVSMSRVVALGYFGLLAGPAVIGWTSQLTTINVALVIPLVCCLAAAALAGVVRPRS